MDFLTTAQAAGILGVGQRDVQRLTQEGELVVVGSVGRALLLDPVSVHRHAGHRVAVGRPWAAVTAWAAIDLLDGGDADSLDATRRRRLRAKLARLTVTDFLWLTRHRAVEHRFFGWRGQLPEIRKAVVAIASSVDDDTLARHFSLSPDPDRVSGYISHADLRQLVMAFELQQNPAGKVALWITADNVQVRPSILLTAIDLATSIDPRERSAGRSVLNDRLAQFRP